MNHSCNIRTPGFFNNNYLEKHLHIISLNVPYPVDYGGVYDLFYKLPALQSAGVKIHLHCYDYGRGPQPALNAYCESVQYYQRNTGIKAFSIQWPYIVSSRINETLAQNLLKDDYPILMEGVHCTFPAFDERFANRKKYVRVYNVEYEYYKSLATTTHHLFKKFYFFQESRLLHRYERQLVQKVTELWAISERDAQIYNDEFDGVRTFFLPLFLPSWKVKGEEGMGSYCLYHGDLSVAQNEKAVYWLLRDVLPGLKIPVVIAGKNPSPKLQGFIQKQPDTCLIANPDEACMQDVIAKAHVNVVPAYSNTGIKIKLLNALYNGRHCLANSPAVEGSGLHELCHIADTTDAMRQRLEQLYHQPFTEQERAARSMVLSQMFCNSSNAQKMVEWIWREG